MRPFPALLIAAAVAVWPQIMTGAQSLEEQNDVLVNRLQNIHDLSDTQTADVRRIFARSPYIGQGNPAVTRHPATVGECTAKLENLSITYDNSRSTQICGARYMAPLYDPKHETAEDAKACIDQFEFPNIPCEYPVVWVRTMEAAEICNAMGKRLCDAHEWEGGCAGQLQPPDYRFDLARGIAAKEAISRMRVVHNNANRSTKSWSYGPQYRQGVCAANSVKTPGCTGGSWSKCGSNTYPAGFFPECHSPLGVYDINGNAAEHMNLPLNEGQMASRGSSELGYTEMKGSWFIFDRYRAHDDWCRWRAPFWHGSRVMSVASHHNYHLGFRCCKTLDDKSSSKNK
ncbi:MAG: SUMF1/EgtB/PvdO family nonheme iron enzyme [Desulforhopalus sp.]